MKMIIAIYTRGESVFEQRLHGENNYEAVIFINTLTVKYLQNTLWASLVPSSEESAPDSRTTDSVPGPGRPHTPQGSSGRHLNPGPTRVDPEPALEATSRDC